MLKTFDPAGWDFGLPPVSLIKLAAAGLRGADRTAFVKRAGDAAALFLPHIDRVKFAAGEEPVHLIAMGADSRYSCNRNGDSWTEEELRASHPTFVSNAKFHRDHRNRREQGDPYYGDVKLAVYNPEMHRVELLAALYRTKEAAARGGGLVADKELDKLARGDDLPVSMATKVPHDTCSFCGNNARTRADYCTAGRCKAGGCRDNLGRLVKVGNDVHRLRVFNPRNNFFDISSVFRGADPTAFGTPATWLHKAAADARVVGGALAAELWGLGVSDPVSEARRTQTKIARALDHLGRVGHGLPPATAWAFAPGVRRPIDVEALTDHGRTKLAGVLGALADAGVVLPFAEFERLVPTPAAYQPAAGATRGTRAEAAKLAADYGLDPAAVVARAERARVRHLPPPAGASPPAARAADYAAYKAAALRQLVLNGHDAELAARLVALQDRV